MKLQRLLVFFVITLFLLLGMTACERSLTPQTAEPETEANPGGVTTGGATSDVMQQIWMLATQTALAQQGQPGLPAGEATAIPPSEGSTNQPEATQPPAEGQPETETLPVVPSGPEASPTPAPPTATLISVPTSTPGVPQTYTLHKGEFPFCIARRYDIDPTALLNANGLGPNTQLSPGYTLNIPQNAGSFRGDRTLRPHPTTITVSSGENIYGIACLFGDVSPEAIAYANGLQPPYNLTAGQTLQIP